LSKRKNEHYLEMIQTINPKDVFPEVVPLLYSLKEEKIKIALASASKNEPFLLEKKGLTPYLDAIVDPAEATNRKPAPDTFL
ncbi:HAD family hydrolase, partial [Enterococcus faecium]